MRCASHGAPERRWGWMAAVRGSWSLLLLAACTPAPPVATRADGTPLPEAVVVPMFEGLSGRTWWFASAPDHVPAIGVDGPLRLWAVPPANAEGGGPGEAAWLRIASPGEESLTLDVGHGLAELEEPLLVLRLMEGLSAADPSVLFGLDRRDLARSARIALDEGACPLWRRIVPLRASGGRLLTEPGEARWSCDRPIAWLPAGAEPRMMEPRLAGTFVAPGSVVLPLGEPGRASAWTETIPGGWALLADGARCQQESLQGRFSGVAFDAVTPGPLRLAALEEIAPSTLRLGPVAELQAREGGALWMGLLPGLGPTPASLRVEPEVLRPSSEEGPPLELVMHELGAAQLRLPALSFRVPFSHDRPVELQGLERGPWALDVTVGAEGWLVRGFEATTLEAPTGVLLQPTLRVVRGGELQLASPEAWPTRGPHLLTLFGEGERIDLSVDFRPQGHVIFGQPPLVPDGSYIAWLRAEVGSGAARDVAFTAVDVTLGEPLALESGPGLTFVQDSDGTTGPTGRMVLFVDEDGLPLGRGAHAVPRRRADGAYELPGVGPEARLVDAATRELVLDRGVPAAGYSVE